MLHPQDMAEDNVPRHTQKGIETHGERTRIPARKTDEIQKYLDEYYPPYHLVKDCSTGRPAIIRDAQMQPFMKIASVHPDRVRFLRKPFMKFAKGHTLLRVLTGPFAGQEGYIVRIDRDRQLVMDFGGIAVAFSGIRNEDVEPVTKD